jgi:hypothetical protein
MTATPMLTYQDRTITGTPGREGLEIVGAAEVLISGCRFVGGSTCLRLNGCGKVTVERCTFEGMTGPADPDGGGLQILRPVGPHVVDHCTFTASPAAEDLLSVFADEPCTGSVLVTGCGWMGRSTSDSGTSLCMDGPYCPPVTVRGGRMQAARCGITVAAGRGHIIDGVRMIACQTKVYVAQLYGQPVGASLIGYTAADVLIGTGVRPGDVIVRAA